MSGVQRPRHVLIILENLPIERDTRVRRECRALLGAGFAVSVICPRASGGFDVEVLPGAHVYRYPAPPPAQGAASFIVEFAYSWLATAVLTARVMSKDRVDVLQACNPPDIYFPLGLVVRLVGGHFVFDHHDLAPELYQARYARRGRLFRLLVSLERATFAAADHVIATNESMRQVALIRGGKPSHQITVVRNGPELAQVERRPPRPELKDGATFLCCWIGVMGALDDGIDVALETVAILVHLLHRRDCHFAFLGDGEAFADMQAMAARLDIEPFVSFTGWMPQPVVFDYLATADLGLQPDPKTERTDQATAIKTMEYMAFGVPVVAFDVHETRLSAGSAAVYASGNDPGVLATLIATLLDDPERRADMGRIGRQRVERELAWDHQKAAYVGVFNRLCGHDGGGD